MFKMRFDDKCDCVQHKHQPPDCLSRNLVELHHNLKDLYLFCSLALQVKFRGLNRLNNFMNQLPLVETRGTSYNCAWGFGLLCPGVLNAALLHTEKAPVRVSVLNCRPNRFQISCPCWQVPLF